MTADGGCQPEVRRKYRDHRSYLAVMTASHAAIYIADYFWAISFANIRRGLLPCILPGLNSMCGFGC